MFLCSRSTFIPLISMKHGILSNNLNLHSYLIETVNPKRSSEINVNLCRASIICIVSLCLCLKCAAAPTPHDHIVLLSALPSLPPHLSLRTPIFAHVVGYTSRVRQLDSRCYSLGMQCGEKTCLLQYFVSLAPYAGARRTCFSS